MKKVLLLFLLLALSALNINASQYEFDESFSKVNGEYNFSTAFREETSLDLIDLKVGMSYMQLEGFDVFKANVKAGFKFWESGKPYVEMNYDDSLNYKRVGAGYEHTLRSMLNEAGYEIFTHNISLGLVYDSSQNGSTWLAGYRAKLSIPYDVYTDRELISLIGDAQLNGFGEKYLFSGEYRMNEQLSIQCQYITERTENNRDDTIMQGLRIRI